MGRRRGIAHHASDVIFRRPLRLDDAVHAGRDEGLMPRLACRSCGRQIYTVAPLDEMFAEERRCPRCGAYLNPERREQERRELARRQEPAADPRPDDAPERRVAPRRAARRRRIAD